MPGALEYNLGRAEPWEGQIYIMGQKKTSLEGEAKQYFCVNKRLRVDLIRAGIFLIFYI